MPNFKAIVLRVEALTLYPYQLPNTLHDIQNKVVRPWGKKTIQLSDNTVLAHYKFNKEQLFWYMSFIKLAPNICLATGQF